MLDKLKIAFKQLKPYKPPLLFSQGVVYWASAVLLLAKQLEQPITTKRQLLYKKTHAFRIGYTLTQDFVLEEFKRKCCKDTLLCFLHLPVSFSVKVQYE